jgi:GNAT superfamily N-acetyltransferase
MSTVTPLTPRAPAAGIQIDRRAPDDEAALGRMYSDVFGEEEAARNQARWRWQYEENPHRPAEGPEIWIAREGSEILGQYATMPVRLKVGDRMVRGSWGMDVMVRRDTQRKGVGSRLFLHWDQHVDASLGLGLSPSSYALFKKLQWEDVGPVPCYTRILDARSLLSRRLGGFGAALAAPAAGALLELLFPARRRAEDPRLRVDRLDAPFGPAFDRLWDKASPGYALIAERSARYLEWKYRRVPFLAYDIFQAVRKDEAAGYVVTRVVERRGARLGLLVDLFAAPDDDPALDALIDRAVAWGREKRVGRLQTFTLDRRVQARLRRQGFLLISSPMQFCVKINTGHVRPEFYRDTSRWHVTFGDSDQDRDR